ncbi:hypothetical protein BH09VER1_BH09VER1_29280 [soil metagenome]
MARNTETKQRGPVETIEGKGVSIPIYYSPYRGTDSYLLAYYAEGKRKRERAASLEIARKRGRELIEDLSTGTAHVAAFTPTQTVAINEAVEILRPLGVSLTEAVRQFADARSRLDGQGNLADAVKFYLEQRAKTQLVPIAVPVLVERLLADFREKEKSRRYVLDMQARLNRAALSFAGNIGDIRSSQIDEWLSSLKDATGRTKNNYRAALITLFSFARQKGYLARGQETEAEYAARFSGKGGEIGIYSPEQLEVLLTEIDPRLLAFVALGAFAGLRTSEIVRLEWPEIRFDQNVIEIKAAKAKTASRRLVPILPVLRAWLEPLRKKTGRVLSGVSDEFAQATQFRKAVARICDDEGKPRISIVHNGLRHSFITYRTAVLKNAAEVALEAGNSTRMIFEHYRELATADEAKAWFAVHPQKKRRAELEKWAKTVAEGPGEPPSKLAVPPRTSARPQRRPSRLAVAAE